MRNLLFLLFLSTSVFAVEKRQKVVVIDTGYSKKSGSSLPDNAFCEKGLLDVTNTYPSDVQGHGTNIIGLVGQSLDYSKFCLISIKWFNYENSHTNFQVFSNLVKALRLALDQNPVLINFSMSGQTFLREEYELIKKILEKNVKFVVSAGNNGRLLNNNCDIYPACYNFSSKSFFVVGSSQPSSMNYSYSNKGGPVKFYENGTNQCSNGICMSGTSQAAAIKSNKLLRGIK